MTESTKKHPSYVLPKLAIFLAIALTLVGCGNDFYSMLSENTGDRMGSILTRDADTPEGFLIDNLKLGLSSETQVLRNKWIDTVSTSNKEPTTSTADFLFDWDDYRFQEVNAFYVATKMAEFFEPILDDLDIEHPEGVKINFSDIPFPSNSYSCLSNTIELSTGGNPPISDTVVAHEFGHALHAQASGCDALLDFDGLVVSESYADFFSVSFTQKSVVGGYRYFEFSNDLSKTARFPENNMTLSEYVQAFDNQELKIWQTYRDGYEPVIDGLKRVAERKGHILEPHVSSKILTTALLSLVKRIGREAALKLVLKGLVLFPVQYSYHDSMLALIAADKELFDEGHRTSIESSFRENGIFKPVIVTILDNDFDFRHKSFSENLWTNQKEILDGQDNDGNGYVDDIHGYDLETKTGDTTKVGDDCGHGTMVADIIGQGSNLVQLNAVRFSFSFFKRFFTNDRLNAAREFKTGVSTALSHGTRILNFSGGMSTGECESLVSSLNPSNTTEQSEAVCDETMAVWTQMFQQIITGNPEILFVFAAGNRGLDNDSSPTYPCNIEAPNVVCVANVEKDGDGSIYLKDSNWGVNSVDLATFGATEKAACGGTLNEYGPIGKTSGAAGYVSRVAAGVFAGNYTLRANDVKLMITETVSHAQTLSSKIKTSGVLNDKTADKAASLSIPLGNHVIKSIEKSLEVVD